ncbi:hypothetical protein OROMI_009087 [Orobanche minor]
MVISYHSLTVLVFVRLLGIQPTKQILDIPDCDDLVTESSIIGMLRYILEHADRNFPQKRML